MNKKLAIISVIFENYDILDDFFKTLKTQTNKNFHLFLVDVSINKKEIKNPKIPFTLIAAENKGYSYAVNIGLKKALKQGFNFFCIANSDIYFKQDFVSQVLQTLIKKPKSIIGGKIYYAAGFEYHKNRYQKKDLGKVIWYAGGIMDWGNVYALHRGVDEVDSGQYDKLQETEFITGCLMCFDKKVINKVGFWDEKYFLYYEDANFCERAKKAGFKLLYNPKIVIWHKNAQSTGGSGSRIHQQYQEKNRLIFGLKYAPVKTKIHLIKNLFLANLSKLGKIFLKNSNIILILFLAIFLRFLISHIGSTYDLESYQIIAKLINSGKNIYAETERYNYSPIWALIVGFFYKISLFFDNNEFVFRSLIILLLSLADISIAAWLFKNYHKMLALFFLFNPLSIYITGFHNQFDNLAIALALWSVLLIENNKKNKNKLLGYLLLSLSICIKHLFIFIIPWLFLKASSKKEKILTLLPLIIFLLSFLPFLSSFNAREGIWKNVLTYKNAYDINPFFSTDGIIRPLLLATLTLIFYFFFKKESIKKLFVLYLLLIIALSPIAANQYLIIPLVGYLVISPLLAIFYIIISLGIVFLNIFNFSHLAFLIFQLSWLPILINFFPQIERKIKILVIFSIVFLTGIYCFNILKDLVKIYQEQRKEFFIMRVSYPVKKVFKNQKEDLKKPLSKNLVLQGEFIAKENNLGFIAIPFRLENPSKEEFFKKNYTVSAKITQVDNPKITFTEIRPINIGLTLDGIILGFPIQTNSKDKKYHLSVFSTIPLGKDFITIDRHSSLQARHFLTKNIIKTPLKIINFLWYKTIYFFSLKSTIIFLFEIFTILYTLLAVKIILKKTKNINFTY